MFTSGKAYTREEFAMLRESARKRVQRESTIAALVSVLLGGAAILFLRWIDHSSPIAPSSCRSGRLGCLRQLLDGGSIDCSARERHWRYAVRNAVSLWTKSRNGSYRRSASAIGAGVK